MHTGGTGVVGYTHVECEGTESSLEQCTAGDLPFRFCSSVGIITQCYTSTLLSFI